MRKRIIACCVIVASLAIASMAIASTGPPTKKENSIQMLSAKEDAAGKAQALTSKPANEVTEASTPKAGVVVLANSNKPITRESGVAVITAPAGTSFEKSFDNAIGTKMRSTGTMTSAGWENPGRDIAVGSDLLNGCGMGAAA